MKNDEYISDAIWQVTDRLIVLRTLWKPQFSSEIKYGWNLLLLYVSLLYEPKSAKKITKLNFLQRSKQKSMIFCHFLQLFLQKKNILNNDNIPILGSYRAQYYEESNYQLSIRLVENFSN